VIEYELHFADFRNRFVTPRGGRLRLGYLNAGAVPPPAATPLRTTTKVRTIRQSMRCRT
jgi:hypothetical protein